MSKKEINRTYQLYELRDNLKEAIENMQKVISQNGLLVDSILNSKNKEALKDLTQGLVEDCKQYTERIDLYKERLEKVNSLITIYEAKDEKSTFLVEVVTKLIEAMGLDSDPEPTNVRA